MLAKVYSAAVYGVEAIEVEIEVNAGSGLSKIVIVGLPDAAVKESQDRVITALSNSGFRWPHGRTTINLAPAHIRKEGPSFDLPIALGMIAAQTDAESSARNTRSAGLTPELLCPCAFAGELALTGAVRPIRGALPIALEARRQGRKALFLPEDNAREAAVVQGLHVFGVRSLRQTHDVLVGAEDLAATREDSSALLASTCTYDVDFSDVKGQQMAKRAIEIAAAGGHNLLMIGPPGSGKSMLAKRLPTILPPLTMEEAIETTKIHSVSGLLDKSRTFVGVRPFRSPHHTISDVGLLGGSATINPGEVSIAHNGVLFLDELPEFKRSTLEVMRQPLEDGRVTISRAAGTMTFPSEFMLVAAMNPCPCGYYGDLKRECRCGAAQIQRYRQKVSGPLLDRIDLHIEVPAVQFDELRGGAAGESSTAIRERVSRARAVQQKRLGKAGRTACNARMSAKQIRLHCEIDDASAQMLRAAMGRMQLSARAHDRILKVGRTIADLAGSEFIQSDHLAEAIQYRELDRSLWQ
jgi:magnesium chelatase family protein